MRIDIWSDVVCPWCYLGKRRLEIALEGFDHRDEVEVVWHSFQLDPTTPVGDPVPIVELLSERYGMTREQAQRANDRVSGLAAEVGLEYHLDRAQHGNTFDAHRLIHLAAAHGRQSEMNERVLQAYFTEGRAVSDREVLATLAGEVGLDEAEARRVLAGDDYADEVRADEAEARALGVTGVPFFVLDGRYGISGAQPVELFEEGLRRAWADAAEPSPADA